MNHPTQAEFGTPVRKYYASYIDEETVGRDISEELGYLGKQDEYYELQKNDELGLYPTDKHAIVACIEDAQNGDEYAKEVLRTASTDHLVRHTLNRLGLSLESVTESKPVSQG